MKFNQRGAKNFHANREANEGTDAQTNLTTHNKALPYREIAYTSNSALKIKL
jgi:hypothetical protein